MKSNDLVYPVYSRKVASFKVIHMCFVQVVSLCCSYCVKRAVIGGSEHWGKHRFTDDTEQNWRQMMLVKDLLICLLVALVPFLWYMLSVWACWLMLTDANNASSHNRTKQLLWSNSNQIFRCYIFQNFASWLTCLLTKLDVKLLSFHTLQWKFSLPVWLH